MKDKKQYVVKTAMNFSVGNDEYYLQPGDQVELPEHPLINSLVTFGHIEAIENATPQKKENGKNK